MEKTTKIPNDDEIRDIEVQKLLDSTTRLINIVEKLNNRIGKVETMIFQHESQIKTMASALQDIAINGGIDPETMKLVHYILEEER